MARSSLPPDVLKRLEGLNAQELRRLLVEHLTERKLGLRWEADLIERDEAVNADRVLPRLVPELSHRPKDMDANAPHANLIIEGDNFDALRLLRTTHAGKIRVIYIDPPYNTGNKDWVYNDRFVGKTDRWRHSQWLEFLYRRLSLARDLLASDGVILVSINDENRARLELLMDEVFPGRRIGSLAWRTKDTGNDLSQRFSHVHEHVLIYANPGFRFNGRATDRNKFRNPDNDPRGEWAPRPITANKSLEERRNTYYPIQDPATGYWYPCDPDSVWRFSSEKKMPDGQRLRSDTIESLIEQNLIYFPPCKPENVLEFSSRDALVSAIRGGKGPMLPKKKTPLLREDLPDLDFWIGKPIANGRPSRKDFWESKPESERVAPLSSWVSGLNEDIGEDNEDDDDNAEVLRSPRGGVATEEVKQVFGAKIFHHPKPLGLIKALLAQATQPNDTVLDFFAGSGTSGQAVLELNAEDDGARRYILCSSTEVTDKEPDKNLCRDVCAERLRRISKGFAGKPGYSLQQGGEFGYLQLDRIGVADAPFEFDAAHAFQWLSLQRFGVAQPIPTGAIRTLGQIGDCAVLVCEKVNKATVDALAEWPNKYGVARLAVYCARPNTLQEQLAARGVVVNAYSLIDALLAGGGA